MKKLFQSTKLLIIIGMLLIISIVIMRYLDTPLKNDICKNGIVSFELAKNIDNSNNILNSWDNHAKHSAKYSLFFDFFFLINYAVFIALLLYRTRYKIKKGFIYLIFIAAIFDVLENTTLLNLVYGNSNKIWSALAYYFASIKFSLIILCLLYLIFNGFILFYKKLK